jgi:hypothetical protein
VLEPSQREKAYIGYYVAIHIIPDRPVIVGEETHLTFFIRQIGHDDMAHENGMLEIDRIVKD